MPRDLHVPPTSTEADPLISLQSYLQSLASIEVGRRV